MAWSNRLVPVGNEVYFTEGKKTQRVSNLTATGRTVFIRKKQYFKENKGKILITNLFLIIL